MGCLKRCCLKAAREARGVWKDSIMQGPLDTLVAETVEEAESAVKAYSPWAVTARHFLSNRLAMVGLVASLALIGVAIFGPLIAPHDPLTQFDSGLSDVGAP